MFYRTLIDKCHITIRLARKIRYSGIRNAHNALLQHNNNTRFSFKRITTEKKWGK